MGYPKKKWARGPVLGLRPLTSLVVHDYAIAIFSSLMIRSPTTMIIQVISQIISFLFSVDSMHKHMLTLVCFIALSGVSFADDKVKSIKIKDKDMLRKSIVYDKKTPSKNVN